MLIEEINEQIKIMLDPQTMKRKKVKEALLYYYKISVVPIIIGIILGAIGIAFFALLSSGIASVFGSAAGNLGFTAPVAVFLLIAGVCLLGLWVIEPLAIVIFAALLQLIGGNLLGVFKGNYEDTVTSGVYSASANILFSWIMMIPVIGWILSCVIGIWAFIISILGLAKLHRTGPWKVLGIMILTGIIVGFLVFLITILIVLPIIVASGIGGAVAHLARISATNRTA